MFNWFRKPADPMQEVQHDPTPTVDEMDKVAATLRADRDYWKRLALGGDTARIKAIADRNAYAVALRNIVAAETPSCANIGKKMARIAREALPEYAAADREAA